MKATVQARLDSDSRRRLQRLARELGWSSSRIVREGLQLLAACHSQPRRKIAGMGKFRSGIRDLGGNKAYLKGFGG